MPDRPPIAEREAGIRAELEAENVDAMTPSQRQKRGRALDVDLEILRRKRLARAARGNLSNAKDPMRALVKRGKLLVADTDRPAVEAGARLRDALIADKGGKASLTAAEGVLVEGAALCMTLLGLCYMDVARNGPFHTTKEGGRVPSAGMAQAPRLLAELRQHCQTLGLGRRAAKADTLQQYLAAKASGLDTADGAIPAEVVVKDEAK